MASTARARRLVRSFTLGALVTAALVIVPAASADAHAALQRTAPAAGEQLEIAPSEVVLTFNEPVQPGPDALRVFDQAGTRVDNGVLRADGSETIAVDLPDDLEASAYVVVFRVISADAHPIAGTTTFTVGDAPPLTQATIDEIAGPGTGLVGVVGSLLRGAAYGGVLLAAGAVVFLAVGRRPEDRSRTARLARPAALVAGAATALHIPVQAAAVSGYGFLETLTSPAALGQTLGSSFGQAAVVRLIGLGLLAVLWRGRAPGWALVTGSAITLGSYLLDGHQRSIDPTWLLVSGDAVHLAGAATWTAGVVLLAITLRAARRDDDPVGAAHLVARFSRLALWSVVTLAVAGTAMSVPLVRHPQALISTTYGWTLVAKLMLVLAIVAVAAYNRQRLVPAVDFHARPAGGSTDVVPGALDTARASADAAWQRLRQTVKVEVALLAMVALVTGFLVSIQPASVAAGLQGPTMVTAAFGDDLQIDLSIDPSAPGLNTIHVYALEPSGQPSDAVDDIVFEFTYLPENIGPIVVEPFAAGPGHWTAVIEDLRFVGPWQVRVIGGVGRFDQAETTIDFNING